MTLPREVIEKVVEVLNDGVFHAITKGDLEDASYMAEAHSMLRPYVEDKLRTAAPISAEGVKEALDIRRHFGNPRLVKIKGLRIVEMPECEGGGYALTGDVAESIVTILQQAGSGK